MQYGNIDNIFKLDFAQRLDIIEQIISQAPEKQNEYAPLKQGKKAGPAKIRKPYPASGLPVRTRYFLCLIFLFISCYSWGQTKATESIPIGRIIDSTIGGGNGIKLMDGSRIKARIVNIGTGASHPGHDHGSYGSDALGGVFNGINDESNTSTGPAGITLSGYFGDKTPANFTRINSNPRDSIDNGDASRYANAAGFHIWTEGNKLIRIKQLLLVDADGASSADNREWFSVFAFNDTARVYPTYTLSATPATKLRLDDLDVSVNWYNLAKDSIPGIDTIRKAEIVRNAYIGTPPSYSGDPDNIATQSLADFGEQLVTDYFVLWGIREDVPTGGEQSSGLSPLVIEYEFDFADAPDSYGTHLASGGPYHILPVNGLPAPLALGDSVSSDVDGQPGVLADGDRDDGLYRVDTISIDTTALSNTVASYTLRAKIKNTTGKTAKAVAWVDWNNDGVFSASEGVSDTAAAPLTTDTLVFSWTGQSLLRSSTSDLSTYARIRLTTEAVSTADARNTVFEDGEVEDYRISFVQTLYDYDDAPDSYGTLKSSGGPAHVFSTGIKFGAVVTADTNGNPGLAANGDTDDGAGVVDTIYLLSSGTSGSALDYTLGAHFTNTTGMPAHLAAWVDWNNNGSFEAGEVRLESASAALTSDTVHFTWTAPTVVRSDTSDHITYVRLRISTDVINASDFNNMTFSNGEVESYAVSIKNAVVLPLDILSFEGEKDADMIRLNWTIAPNAQLSAFKVLRSNDGKVFNPLGQIRKAEYQSQYSFQDEAPLPGLNLYRLSAIAAEGKVIYAAQTLSIHFDGSSNSVTVFPNPAQDKVVVHMTGPSQSVHAVLYNATGAAVLEKKLDQVSNYLETGNLDQGIYYLEIFDGPSRLLIKPIQVSK